MSKNIKYYFDHATLSYKKVTTSFFERFKTILLWFITTGSVWIVIYFTIAHFIPTPKEMTLRNELDNMTVNYEMLQKQMDANEKVLSDLENRDENVYRVIFEADPYTPDKRQGTLSPESYFDQMRGYNYSDMIIQSAKRVENISKRIYAESKSLDQVVDLALKKEELLRSIPAIPPVSVSVLRSTNISGFGMRLHPFSKLWKMHTGMDFSARTGTPIYASGDGKVISVLRSAGGYGNHVIIDHGFGYKTLYAHMHKISTAVGKKVVRGEVIGTVGNTGQSKGSHLHYEVIYKGTHVNPINYYYKDLTVSEYNELLQRAAEHSSPLD